MTDLARAAQEMIAHKRRMDIARRIVKSLLCRVGTPQRATKTGAVIYLIPPRRGGTPAIKEDL